MAKFLFEITEPNKSPKVVSVGPHETAYGAKRAIQHVYAEGTTFKELSEYPAETPPETSPPEPESVAIIESPEPEQK